MPKMIISGAVLLILISGVWYYTKTSNPSMGNMQKMPDGTMMHNTAPSDQKEEAMMDHSMMMVGSEKEFIAGMIPHHQEAVDTAKEVLERGGSTPQIRQLAENIISSQEKEITEMKTWYQAWYGEVYQETGEYAPMMRGLSTLSGADLDKVFLADMVSHHLGAIMMAKSAIPHLEHSEAKALADSIITTQAAEVELMKELKADLDK